MTDAAEITIYHNPNCGTSRNVLAAIRAAGHEPNVVEYLKVGWTPGLLAHLMAAMDAGPKDLLRIKGTPAEDLGLLAPGATDDQILDAMVAHPILVERPIVATPWGAKLCRPSETVAELLGRAP